MKHLPSAATVGIIVIWLTSAFSFGSNIWTCPSVITKYILFLSRIISPDEIPVSSELWIQEGSILCFLRKSPILAKCAVRSSAFTAAKSTCSCGLTLASPVEVWCRLTKFFKSSRPVRPPRNRTFFLLVELIHEASISTMSAVSLRQKGRPRTGYSLMSITIPSSSSSVSAAGAPSVILLRLFLTSRQSVLNCIFTLSAAFLILYICSFMSAQPKASYR